MKIKILPQSLVNKIAAGEVIERPASIVKELVENSLDANSSNIEIYVVSGGKKLIKVVDDGVGIDYDDLQFIFKKHATSKISSDEDLFKITTYGFRGEALVSISAVSKVKLISKVRNELSGGLVELEGGKAKIMRVGSPDGTTVEVRNLFYNVPARLKFLRADNIEFEHILDRVIRLAIPNYKVGFKLYHNEEPILLLTASSSVKERIKQIFGEDVSNKIIFVQGEAGLYKVDIYLYPPPYLSTISRLPIFYCNNRYIKDSGLSRALYQAGSGFVHYSQKLLAIVFIYTEPRNVDVNVHPTKIEVRFKDNFTLYDLIIREIRNKLSSLNIPATLLLSSSSLKDGISDVEKVEKALDNLFLPTSKTGGGIPQAHKGYLPFNWTKTLSSGSTSASEQSKEGIATSFSVNVPVRYYNKRQIRNSYILVETDEGIEIYDQHALDEKIRFYKIRENIAKQGKLASQRLVLPEVIDGNLDFIEHLVENEGILSDLGFEFQIAGKRSLVISSIPAILKAKDIRSVISEINEVLKLVSGKYAREEVIDELCSKLACISAVKSGEKLAEEEIEALIEESRKTPGVYTCAHGRPTRLIITYDELDKYFKRS